MSMFKVHTQNQPNQIEYLKYIKSLTLFIFHCARFGKILSKLVYTFLTLTLQSCLIGLLTLG